MTVKLSGSPGSSSKELLVGASGVVRVLATAGGRIVGAGGARAVHIANPTIVSVTAGAVLASKANANWSALDTSVESILTALRNIGVLATS